MPDPVEHRPRLTKLGSVSKSLSDLRGRYQRGNRIARDDFGTPWQQAMHPDVPPLPSASTTNVATSPPTPTPTRPWARAHLAARPPRPPRKESLPAAWALRAAGSEPNLWPCGPWAPQLGPNSRTPLALPPAVGQESFPPHFDAATIECVRHLIVGQCRADSIDAAHAQNPYGRESLPRAARFVALQCIEKREQLKRDQQNGLRDARGVAEHRDALLLMLSRLVDANVSLAGRLRETSQRTVAHFACLWADEGALACLMGQRAPSVIDFNPLFAIPEHGVERFCLSLRADLSVKMPELEALCAPLLHKQDAATARCYRLIIGAFAAEVPHHTRDMAPYARAFLLRGLYFFSGLAVHHRDAALIDGLLQAALQLSLQQHVATTALQMCLQNSFLSGASVCLKPTYEAAATMRVVLADGSTKLDFGFHADRTPLHLLAERRYDTGGVSQQEAIAMAEVLHEYGADARALSLVNILPNRHLGARDTLVSPATLALLNDNPELAKRLARLAQRRDQQEKLASLATRTETSLVEAPSLRWRADLIARVAHALEAAMQRLSQRRAQVARQVGHTLGAAGDIDEVFATLKQIFERVFYYNLEHGFGLRDTGEVRFARAISQLRVATEQAHTEIQRNYNDFDDIHAPRLSRVMFAMQRALLALRDIDLHRSDSDSRRTKPIGLAECQHELFEDGATNLSVLRQDDRFGTLRPLPLLATLPSPLLSWVETYLQLDRQKATYDCVAAFSLSIGGAPGAPLPENSSRATGRVPILARQMLDTFDVTRNDWDVLLTGYLLAALRQHHHAAVLAVIACADRCLGGLHKLPLEEIPAVAALAIDTHADTLRAVMAADRHGRSRWSSKWKTTQNAAGETLLHQAARCAGDEVAVLSQAARDSMRRLAIERDLSGQTPAHIALACGHLDAFFALWELCPQLDAGVRVTFAGLQAFAGPEQAGLRRMAHVVKSERLRGQLFGGLLLAAVWYDDRDCLARLLAQADWQDCVAFADGDNLLHLVASWHAPRCLELLKDTTDTRFCPTGELFFALAERPNRLGTLPQNVARDEHLRRRLQAALKHRLLPGTARTEAGSGRSNSPKWGLQNKPLSVLDLHVPHSVVRLSQPATGISGAEQHRRFFCQRQAAHMMLRQPTANAREQLIDTFLHNPELLEWARPSSGDTDRAARENVAWELLLALDQAERHKAFGVRLRAQMPDVSLRHIEKKVRSTGRCLGRFASSDSVPLLELRQALLTLCDSAMRDAPPTLDDAADMAVTMWHPKLRALCVQPCSPSLEGVECRQTRALRFEVRRHWQSRAIEILDVTPMMEAAVESYGYDQLQPIAQALS